MVKHFRPVLMLTLVSLLAQNAVAQTGFGQSVPTYVTVIDPREKAFSIEVPSGWKAYGGMFRFNAVDARPFVDLNSPDGSINVRIGDATIPSYDMPNATLQRLGSIGKYVAPYASGEQFAAKYGMARFSTMCQELRMVKTGQKEPTWGRGSGPVSITAGFAAFTCSRNGQPTGAYVYTETLAIAPTLGSAGHWYVTVLGSAIAPLAQGMFAGAILEHCYRSIALNPEWIRSQGQIVAQAKSQVQGWAAWAKQVNDQAVQNFQKNMKMQAQESANFNDVLLGQQYMRNPATGQTYVVPNGNGGPMWVDGANAIRESQMVPGAGFTQLQTISR